MPITKVQVILGSTSTAKEAILTPEQAQIQALPPEDRALVVAPAGTGKTLTLRHRLEFLVDEGLQPGSEILVLSFSRAAVREIKRRLIASESNASHVRVRTFDSFATYLLSLILPNGSWQEGNYEDRIRRASALLDTSLDAKEEIQYFRHIIVDETQDLVGCRAEFVQKILDVSQSGFTLFGDPAQAIFNFQLRNEGRGISSPELYDWLRRTFKDLKTYPLNLNHRAKTPQAKAALWAGPQLATRAPSYVNINTRLCAVLRSLPTSAPLDKHNVLLSPPAGRRTAILCKTNGDSLYVSRELFKAGLPHALRTDGSDRMVTPWIARVLRVQRTTGVAKSKFAESIKELVDVPDPDLTWNLLKQLERGPEKDRLNLELIVNRLRTGDVPDPCCAVPSAALTVSTIHRAKGLEFETVIIQRNTPIPGQKFELDEETRLLYVALTRCTEEMYQRDPIDYGPLAHDCGRWYERGFQGRWQRTTVELRGEDTDRLYPPGTFGASLNAPEVQAHITNHVKQGDSVDLTRFSAGDRVHYAICHQGTVIGATSGSFGGSLFQILKINNGWTVNWPAKIKNVRVEAVDSVAGLSGMGPQHGLGPCDAWLRVRLSGLGNLVFERTER